MPTWLSYYRADLRRYTENGSNAARQILMEQGLWALLQYRIASQIHRSRLPRSVRLPLLLLLAIWRKVLEMTTGITLPKEAVIGPGLYIGHYGNIIISPQAKLGSNCNISQGVTIGVSGQGDRRGVPVIGDGVYIAAHAVVVGRITVGDAAAIGANTLVNRDVAPYTTVLGVPATVVSDRRSINEGEPRNPKEDLRS